MKKAEWPRRLRSLRIVWRNRPSPAGSSTSWVPAPRRSVLPAGVGSGNAAEIRRKLWSEEEREAGITSITMGLISITEGAIPFAASDPVRVIPCIMAGSMTAAALAMMGGVKIMLRTADQSYFPW